MMTLGRAGDDALARRFARALAMELSAVGITLDFAPVLDILTNTKNPAIGDRALAEDGALVSKLGVAIIDELQGAGLAACGKHFPGHGDTSVDSHHELPVVEHGPDRLRAVEFGPFRAAIAAGVASIMTAHVLVPALDEQYPATLSSRIVRPLLREELGFDGVIFTDDMEMKAIAAHHGVPQAAVRAIAAGVDGVLVCSGDTDLQAATLEAIIHAVEDETLPFSRVEDALSRHRRMKARFAAAAGPGRVPGPLTGRALREALGRESHAAIAEEMRRFA
jgi:beta-N-acetylhexosaminidase